jgi:hypothetical protein
LRSAAGEVAFLLLGKDTISLSFKTGNFVG